MDWLGGIFKLASWFMVSRKNRTGFVLGILGNVLLVWVSYDAELYGISVYCLLLSIIQIGGWFRWRKK